MSNLSIIIPSHEREKSIISLVDSLLSLPENFKVIVVDTSLKVNELLKHREGADFHYKYLSENKWISHSRNLWLSEVDTDFSLFMDDDFQLSPKTNLSGFLQTFKESGLDVLGWSFNNIGTENFDFHWIYDFKDNTLFHYVWLKNHVNEKDFEEFHIIHNYFITQTQTILDLWGWDSELKFAREHDDFFLSARNKGLHVGYTPEFWINHHHGVKHYELYDSKSSIEHFCNKWGIASKVEVRLIHKANQEPYLSITRFMGYKTMELQEEELGEIYSKYWFHQWEVPYVYSHVL